MLNVLFKSSVIAMKEIQSQNAVDELEVRILTT